LGIRILFFKFYTKRKRGNQEIVAGFWQNREGMKEYWRKKRGYTRNKESFYL
jgi:hypothetical protein